MMMRKTVLPVAALSGAMLATSVLAAAAQSPCVTSKIAYVQGATILSSLPEYVRADSSLQAANAGYQRELQRMGAALDSAANAFQENSTILSPSAKKAEMTKLQDQKTQLDQHEADLQQKAAQQRQELLGPIETRVTDVIDGLRAELNCAIILDASSQAGVILSADKSLDLTQRVIDRLKSGSTAAPPPPAPSGIKPPTTPPHKP